VECCNLFESVPQWSLCVCVCVCVVVSHLYGRVLVTCLSLPDLHKMVPDRVSCFHLLSSHPVRTNSRPVHRFTWFIYLVVQQEKQLKHGAAVELAVDEQSIEVSE
jgi:hypothetical protein